MTTGSEIVGAISFVRGEVYAKRDQDCSVCSTMHNLSTFLFAQH